MRETMTDVATITIVLIVLIAFAREHLAKLGLGVLLAPLVFGVLDFLRWIAWGVGLFFRWLGYVVILRRDPPVKTFPPLLADTDDDYVTSDQPDEQTDRQTDRADAPVPTVHRLRLDRTRGALIEELLTHGWTVGEIRGVLKGDNNVIGREIQEARERLERPARTPWAERDYDPNQYRPGQAA